VDRKVLFKNKAKSFTRVEQQSTRVEQRTLLKKYFFFTKKVFEPKVIT